MIIVSDPEQGRRKCHSLALTAATLANIQTGYLGCKLLVSGGPKRYAGIVIGAIHKFFSTLISQQTEKERENICACILFVCFLQLLLHNITYIKFVRCHRLLVYLQDTRAVCLIGAIHKIDLSESPLWYPCETNIWMRTCASIHHPVQLFFLELHIILHAKYFVKYCGLLIAGDWNSMQIFTGAIHTFLHFDIQWKATRETEKYC